MLKAALKRLKFVHCSIVFGKGPLKPLAEDQIDKLQQKKT